MGYETDPILEDVKSQLGDLFGETEVDFNEIDYKGFWRHTTINDVQPVPQGTWPSGDLKSFEAKVQFLLRREEDDKPLTKTFFVTIPKTFDENGKQSLKGHNMGRNNFNVFMQAFGLFDIGKKEGLREKQGIDTQEQ